MQVINAVRNWLAMIIEWMGRTSLFEGFTILQMFITTWIISLMVVLIKWFIVPWKQDARSTFVKGRNQVHSSTKQHMKDKMSGKEWATRRNIE